MNVTARRRSIAEYKQVLGTIFEFMLASGLNSDEIAETASIAVQRAKRSSPEYSPSLPGGIASAALVLDAWHRDRLYLTRLGRPRAIRWNGPAPSLEALVRSQSEHRDVAKVLLGLRTHKLIVSCGHGRYKPASDVALLSNFDPLAIQHVGRTLSMLLRTVRQNLTTLPTTRRLIERNAEVPDLPVEHVDAFRRFAELQGWIFLRTVNDWLEIRRAKRDRTNKATVPAGVHVHAYLENSDSRPEGGTSSRVRIPLPAPSTPSAKSSPHCSWAIPAGSKHAAAPCKPREIAGRTQSPRAR